MVNGGRVAGINRWHETPDPTASRTATACQVGGSEASLGRRLLSSRCLPVLSFYGSLRTRMPGSWDWFCSVQTSRADDRFFSELDGFELLHARQLKILQ